MNTPQNILIAKFMGFVFYDDENKYYNAKEGYFIESIQFNESWDLLIPIIEKCRECQLFGSQRLIYNIDNRLLELDLLATYSNVLDFIEWHNNQKTTIKIEELKESAKATPFGGMGMGTF